MSGIHAPAPGLCSRRISCHRLHSKPLKKDQCRINAVQRKRQLLLGGLVSLSSAFGPRRPCKADETALEEEVLLDQQDVLDPSRSPSISSLISIFGDQWLSLFSIVTSVSLGAIAVQFKTQVDSTEDALKKKEALVGSLTSQLHLLNTEHSQLVKSLEDARKTVQLQSKQIQVERKEGIRLDDKLSKLQGDYAAREKDIAVLKQEIVNNEAESKNKLKNAEDKVATLKHNLDGAESVAEDRKSQILAIQRVLSSTEEELAVSRSHIGDLDAQIKSAELSLAEERERLVTLEKARVAAVNDIKKLLSEQRNLSFELKAEVSTVSDLRQSLQDKEVELAGLKEKLSENVNRARSAHVRLTTAEQEVGQLKQAQLVSLMNEKALAHEIEDLKLVICENKNSLIALEERASHLTNQLEAKEAIIEGLEADANTKHEEILALNSVQKNSEQEKCNLKATVSEMERMIQAGENALIKLKAECAQLKESVDEAEKNLGIMEAKMVAADREISSLRRELARKQKDVAFANQKLYGLQNEIAKLEAETGRLAGVEEQLGMLTKEAAEVQEKLIVANKKSEELEYSQSQLKEAKANMKAMREELLVAQSGGRGELRKVKMQLSLSQEQVRELKESVENLKKQASKSQIPAKGIPQSQTMTKTKKLLSSAEGGKMTPGSSDGSSPAQDASDKKDIRIIAEVRAQAVQIVEEIEDSAGNAIENAHKAAKASEKAALKGLLAATSAQGEVDRLQGSLDSAQAELTKKNDEINQLRSKVSQLSASSPVTEECKDPK